MHLCMVLPLVVDGHGATDRDVKSIPQAHFLKNMLTAGRKFFRKAAWKAGLPDRMRGSTFAQWTSSTNGEADLSYLTKSIVYRIPLE